MQLRKLVSNVLGMHSETYLTEKKPETQDRIFKIRTIIFPDNHNSLLLRLLLRFQVQERGVS